VCVKASNWFGRHLSPPYFYSSGSNMRICTRESSSSGNKKRNGCRGNELLWRASN